jgi:hypothetical protein
MQEENGARESDGSCSVVASPGTGPEGVPGVHGWCVDAGRMGRAKLMVAAQSWHPLAQGQRACLVCMDGA